MAKYHIGKDGLPHFCKAKIKCTLSNSDRHFDTLKSAELFIEKSLKAKENSFSETNQKTVGLSKATTPEELKKEIISAAKILAKAYAKNTEIFSNQELIKTTKNNLAKLSLEVSNDILEKEKEIKKEYFSNRRITESVISFIKDLRISKTDLLDALYEKEDESGQKDI